MNVFHYLKITFINRFFQLQGRASRREFCYGFIALMVISMVWTGAVMSFVTPDNMDIFLFMMWFNLIFILLSIPAITLTVRRLHDSNRSGLYYFLSLVPILNLYLAYLLFLEPGTEGANTYGPVEQYK